MTYTVDDTMKKLLGAPEAVAVLERFFPKILKNPALQMTAAMTLRQVAGFAQSGLTADSLAEIDAQLRGTVSRTIAAALRSGQDPAARVAALKEENLALQKERAAQLEQAGYPPDVLTEQPACPACGDTGYGPDGAMCTCLRAYYVEEQNRELSKLLNIGAQSFETFSLD